MKKLLCWMFGHWRNWLRYGDPVLCPPGVEPWTCRRCGDKGPRR